MYDACTYNFVYIPCTNVTSFIIYLFIVNASIIYSKLFKVQ